MLEPVLIIIAVNLALYFRTLRFKFVSDDCTVFHNPPVAKNLLHKWWLRFIGATKYLSTSIHFVRHNNKSFMVKAKKEEAEHLIALLIHIAIGISIYFAFGGYVGFITALLYSVNPVNNQATIWPGGRGYALPILSLMLSMAVPILSPVLIYFGMWFTIGYHGIPLALIGSEKWYLLALAVPYLFIHGRKFTKAIKLKSGFESFTADKTYDWNKITVFIKTYGFYLTLCVIPFKVTFYHNFLQSMAGSMKDKAHSIWDKFFWIGLVGIIGTITYASISWNPVSWGLVAFLLTIAPFCNVVRANQEIAERFTAFPNLFLMYALAVLITPYPYLVTAFLAFYATRTFYTVMMYKDEYWITEVSVVEDPEAWWVWHCRGMKRWDTQSYKEALILWVMAKIISPREFKVLMNISTALRMLGNHKEADEHLKLAEENIVPGQEATALEFIEQHRKGKLPILL